MDPPKIWLLTLLVSIFLQLHCAEAQDERKMRHFCTGSSNGMALVHAGPDPFDTLRVIYQNCTRVYGNVEITYLDSKMIGNRTFDFFDDIEQIDGYILISMVRNIKRISFKKLTIIKGDILFHEAAIYIDKASSLGVLSMPKLRSIEKGVVQAISTRLCHLQNKINPDKILNYDRTRYLPHKNSTAERIKFCSKPVVLSRTTCHPSCNDACWGPEKEDCQIEHLHG